jgi:hypothetical protein
MDLLWKYRGGMPCFDNVASRQFQRCSEPPAKTFPAVIGIFIRKVDQSDNKLFLNQPQLKAYENVDMTIDADDLEMPKDGTAGQKLTDGTVTMKINLGMPLKVVVDIKNRSVAGEEEVETPAGKFKCIKLVEDVFLQIAFAKTSYQTVTWYATNHGVIKQETYGLKKKKKTGYSMLTEIKK